MYSRKLLKKILKFSLYIIFSVIGLLFIIGVIFYYKYIKKLPSSEEFSSNYITKNKIENYVVYEDINPNLVNAIVSLEDKDFFKRNKIGLISFLKKIIIGDLQSYCSPIIQQIINNNQEKIYQNYLCYQISSGLDKEKILELYLNTINFGNKIYGINEASQTFFEKKPKDLEILESSIISSLTGKNNNYYKNPDKLLGYPYIYNTSKPEELKKILTKDDFEKNINILTFLANYIEKWEIHTVWNKNSVSDSETLLCGLEKDKMIFSGNIKDLKIDENGCAKIDYIDFLNILNSINIHYNNDNYSIKYEAGKKDFVLQRMLEDGYIDFNKYKENIISSLGYEFKNK